MIVPNYFPIFFWQSSRLLTSYGLADRFSVCHFSQIKTIIQYPSDTCCTPRTYFTICIFLFRLSYLRDSGYIFLKKLSCYLYTGFPLHRKRKDIAHNFCLSFIHNNCIFFFFAFFISKGNLSENIFSLCTLIFNRSLYLN